MSSAIILPVESHIYRLFKQLVSQQKILMFAGVPGVGKSLMLQQAALLAHQAGRVLHQMQWDVSRTAFEMHPYVLERYPEVDGVTHAVVRKAVGLWARGALANWHATYTTPDHLLMGELPLVGNRLTELVQRQADAAETLLAADFTTFVVPAPSKALREVIEAARAASIAQPRHENEKWDAPPNVLQMLWEDLHAAAVWDGLTDSKTADYDPAVYLAAFERLLRHRNSETVLIDQQFKSQTSAYDLPPIASQLRASEAQVLAIVQDVEARWTLADIEKDVTNWYMV